MLNINGVFWTIYEVSSNHPALKQPNGIITIGACDNTSHSIYINGSLNQYLFKKVLYHEIAHAVIFSYDVSLSEDEEELFSNLIATYGEEIIFQANKIFSNIKKKGTYNL